MSQRDRMIVIMAFVFLAIYTVVQLYTIYTPGAQDDAISARMHDVVLIIIGYYFGRPAGSK